MKNHRIGDNLAKILIRHSSELSLEECCCTNLLVLQLWHGVISQKTPVIINNTVKASDHEILCYVHIVSIFPPQENESIGEVTYVPDEDFEVSETSDIEVCEHTRTCL
jgi:hypothetical protein